MTLPSSSRRRIPLACTVTSLLALHLPVLAQSSTWLGAPNSTSWSNAAFWQGGIVADGADNTAAFIHDPIADADATRGGTVVLDSARTIGNLIFEDTAGYGSSSMSIGGTLNTLTFDTTTGQPTLLVGQVLNSQSGGKKAIIAHNIVGTDGLVKLGPGFLGMRSGTANTITGDYVIAGGIMQQQSAFGSVSNVIVRGGATVFLDFATSGAAGADRLNPNAPLFLGGAGGGGVVVNNNVAATSNHSQTFNGVSVLAGASQIVMGTNTNQNMTYTLGSISNAPGGALNLSRTNVNGTGVFNVTNANVDGIIGSWMTFNQGDWAAQSGSGTAVAYTGYTPNTWGAGLNTNVTTHGSLNIATTNTLRFNVNYPTQLKLSGVNTIATGGIIAAQQSPLITGGTLTTGNANGDLFVHANGGQVGLRIQSNIADNGATPLRLVKSLNGALSIESDMSYTGGTIIGSGIVYLGTGPTGSSAGSLGTGDILLSANSTGTGSYNPNGILAFNRSGTYTVTNNINATVNGGGLIGQTAGNGTLILNRPMKLGGLIAQAGTTRLDFNAPSAPVSEIIDGSFTVGPTTLHTARLTLRTANLEVLGKDGAATVQTFALTDILGNAKISVTPGVGGTALLNLGTPNRVVNNNDGGGTLALTLAAGASVTTSSGAANSILLDAGGVAFATVNGTEWAAKDAANVQIVPGSSIAGFYTGTTGAGITGGNVDLLTNDSVTGAIQTNSVRFNTASAGTITVNAGGTLRPGGILVTPAVGANVSTIAGPGDLRANTGNRDLPLIQNNTAGKLVIAAPVANFDATNVTHLVKAGAGEVELTAANSYTGRTFVSEGILRVSGTAQVGNATTRAGSIFGRGGEVIVQDSASVFSGAFNSFGHRAGDAGILTVKDNATYDVNGDFNIGDVNSAGTLNISGNALLTIKSLFVGKAGYATGVVNQTGGTLIAGNTPAGEWNIGGNVADSSAAVGTYNLSGGVLNALGQNFQVGRFGTGTFNLSGTGQVQGTGFHVLGRQYGSSGTLSISENGSWNANPGGAGQNFFILGELGSATLNIADNGTLTAKGLSLAHNGGSAVVNQTGGTVDLQSTAPVGAIQAGVVFGQANAPGLLTEGYGGTYNLNGGTLKTFGIRENPGVTTPVSSVFNFNGGTVQAIGNNPTFMQGLDAANVRVGGAKFDTSGFDVAVAQALVHEPTLGPLPDGGLVKLGTGRLELSGINTYDGLTSVQAGTLVVSGSISSSSLTTVNVNGTLSGTGVVGALKVNGGTLAPGASPGILQVGSVEFAGGTFALEINGLLAGNTIIDHDQLIVTGSVSITQPTELTLSFGNGFNPTTGDSFLLINNDGADAISTNSLFTVGGVPIGDNVDFIYGGQAFQLDYNNGSGNDLVLLAVPEPGSAALLLGGLGLMAASRRRRR